MSLLFLINCFRDPVTLKKGDFFAHRGFRITSKTQVVQVGAKQSICESFIKAKGEKEGEKYG